MKNYIIFENGLRHNFTEDEVKILKLAIKILILAICLFVVLNVSKNI